MPRPAGSRHSRSRGRRSSDGHPGGFRPVSTEAPHRSKNTACDEDRYRILSSRDLMLAAICDRRGIAVDGEIASRGSASSPALTRRVGRRVRVAARLPGGRCWSYSHPPGVSTILAFADLHNARFRRACAMSLQPLGSRRRTRRISQLSLRPPSVRSALWTRPALVPGPRPVSGRRRAGLVWEAGRRDGGCAG